MLEFAASSHGDGGRAPHAPPPPLPPRAAAPPPSARPAAPRPSARRLGQRIDRVA
jgi:hypothetical protein